MTKNKLITPFLKWVGGKRQLVSSIEDLKPKRFNYYCEPFVGGGAILFHLQPKRAIINDFNSELINVYRVIRDNLDELILDLKKHKNEADYFYNIRGLDRTDEFKKLSNIERASRVIYLNKTCFNGLYRVNNSGEFNTPFGRYKKPNFINEITLKAVHYYLNKPEIKILNGDYEEAIKELKKGAFVYFDPPYHPISESSNFTGYTKGGFNESEQKRLKRTCDELDSKGINFLLSNSSSQFIIDLYSSQYNINHVKASRAINSNAKKRGDVDEVLIRNYE